jgi:glycolate oxidase FAD binding subunit
VELTAMRTAQVGVQAVVHATGIGTLLFTGNATEVRSLAQLFRKRMEATRGSLVSHSPALLSEDFDAWGNPGNALPLMRAVKHQLDPGNILNPGRFVGGI